MKRKRVLTHWASVFFRGVSRAEPAHCGLFDGNRYYPCDPYL